MMWCGTVLSENYYYFFLNFLTLICESPNTCTVTVSCREGICTLQRRLQPLPHHGCRLPHAAPQNGRPAGGGHCEAQERNWPQWRLPAPIVPTQREAGEGGQAELGGGQTKDQMKAGEAKNPPIMPFKDWPHPLTKPAPIWQTDIHAFIFVHNYPSCSHTHTPTYTHTHTVSHTDNPKVLVSLLLLCQVTS